MVCDQQHDYSVGNDLCAESVAILREQGDAWELARALYLFGNVAHKRGDYAAARKKILRDIPAVVVRGFVNQLRTAAPRQRAEPVVAAEILTIRKRLTTLRRNECDCAGRAFDPRLIPAVEPKTILHDRAAERNARLP